MKDVIRLLKGYVTVRLTGRMPERFLKMCAHHRITLNNIRHCDGAYEMELSVKDYFRLKPLCRKSGSRIHILEKHGLPFFFYRNKKRKAFFLGILACLLLLGILSTRIWNIHIEGNYSLTVPTVLKYLKEYEIDHGMAKKKVNCSKIAAGLREEFPNIIWVSARIKGTRLLITIQENMDYYGSTPDEVPEEEGSWDLVAGKDGKVVEIVTRTGIPQVQAGDICQKGDILVSGRLDIMNDSQEVIRREYVGADADVYLESQYSYKDEFPMTYKKRMYTKKKTSRIFLQILDYRFTLGTRRGDSKACDSVTSQHTLRLTENFVLPIGVGKTVDFPYEIITERYSREEAEAIAGDNLKKFMEKLSEKGVKISGNNVKIAVNENTCISGGTVTLIENAGRRAPVEVLPEPEERTLVDEQ